MEIYSGYLKDNKALSQSASGGCATAISLYVLNHNGCVYGVEYSEDFEAAQYCCVEDVANLYRLKSTKYVEPNKFINDISVYEHVANQLKNGRMVCFFGLGCDVAAVKTYCEKKQIRTDKLYTVDILCHGPLSKKLHCEYVKAVQKKYKSKIIELNVRYKKDGNWTPPYIKIVFENGKKIEKQLYDTDYGFLFSKVALSRCTDCKFKGENHRGEICIGNFWGIDKTLPIYNKYGVSIILIQNEKGKDIIEWLSKSDFELTKINDITVLQSNPMYFDSRIASANNAEIEKSIEEFGFKQGLKSNELYRIWLRNTKIKHLKNLIKKALNRDKV